MVDAVDAFVPISGAQEGEEAGDGLKVDREVFCAHLFFHGNEGILSHDVRSGLARDIIQVFVLH